MRITLRNDTIKALLDYSLEHYSMRPAIAFSDEKPKSYKEVGQQVVIFSERLKERGIQKVTVLPYSATTVRTGSSLI